MTQQRHKRAMNLAIDRLLDQDERSALDAHLDQSPDDARLWGRMQRADRMLRSAPMIHAPQSFSTRLMSAIAAGRQPTTDTRYGLGIAIGLMVAAFTAIPILGIVLFIIGSILSDMTALQLFLSQIILILNGLSLLVGDLMRAVSTFVTANPLIVVLALVMLPLTALWGYMMWGLMTRYQQVTYRIPVRVVAS